jgi:hypothetical protein
MGPRLALRRFLYLDDRLTNEYLGQVEGGLYDEEAQAASASVDSKRGGGVKAGPVRAEAGRTTGGEESSARTVRQTPESAFTRLSQLLEEHDAVQFLDAFDDAIWNQLRRGEVLEVEVNIQVPALVKFGQMATEMGSLIEVMSSFGEDVDAETQAGMEGLSGIVGLIKGVPIIAAASGAPRFKLIAHLDEQNLRVNLDELEGEATLYCTIERRHGPSKQWSLLDSMPSLSGLPTAEKRGVARELKKVKQLTGSVVSPPLARVSPIAIYR